MYAVADSRNVFVVDAVCRNHVIVKFPPLEYFSYSAA